MVLQGVAMVTFPLLCCAPPGRLCLVTRMSPFVCFISPGLSSLGPSVSPGLSLSHLRLPVWLSASLLFSSPVSCPPSFLPRPQHGGSLEDSLWLCRAQQCRLQPQSSGSWLCSNWQSSSEVLSSLCAWSSIRGPLPSF